MVVCVCVWFTSKKQSYLSCRGYKISCAYKSPVAIAILKEFLETLAIQLVNQHKHTHRFK